MWNNLSAPIQTIAGLLAIVGAIYTFLKWFGKRNVNASSNTALQNSPAQRNGIVIEADEQRANHSKITVKIWVGGRFNISEHIELELLSVFRPAKGGDRASVQCKGAGIRHGVAYGAIGRNVKRKESKGEIVLQTGWSQSDEYSFWVTDSSASSNAVFLIKAEDVIVESREATLTVERFHRNSVGMDGAKGVWDELGVSISDPSGGDEISTPKTVKGKISSTLPNGCELWLMTVPRKYEIRPHSKALIEGGDWHTLLEDRDVPKRELTLRMYILGRDGARLASLYLKLAEVAPDNLPSWEGTWDTRACTDQRTIYKNNNVQH